MSSYFNKTIKFNYRSIEIEKKCDNFLVTKKKKHKFFLHCISRGSKICIEKKKKTKEKKNMASQNGSSREFVDGWNLAQTLGEGAYGE